MFSLFTHINCNYQCFSEEYYVKTVTLPNIYALFANNCCIQIPIIEKGFAEQF
jgi:hypothetical protein